MIDLKQLNISDLVFNTISDDYRLIDITSNDFNEIIKSSIWEIFIENSLHWNSKQKLNNDFLSENYISKNFENDLIWVYQQILNKLDNNENSDLLISDNLTVSWSEFESVLKSLKNVILANNINYLKSIVSKSIKSHIDNDKFLEWLDLAVWELTKRLSSFDVNKWFSLKTYIEPYLKQEINKVYESPLKEYPKEYYKIHKFLKIFSETKQEYTYFWNYELLLTLIWDINNLDKKTVKDFWRLYFYILWFWEVTVKHFCDTFWIKEDIDIPSFFRNEKNVDVFIENILDYLKEYKDNNTNNKWESYLLKKLLEVNEWLNLLEDWWVISLDTKVWEDSDTTLLESLWSDNWMWNFETSIYQRDNKNIWDREIRHKWKPNINWTYLERIIAWTCINEYFTFKEFRDMLLEYWEQKWEWEKFKDNFHTYLSLFKFKDKSNWYQYDNRVLDALTFEQMWDILWFSKQYAIKVYKKLKEKFDTFYWPHIVFIKYDTWYHWPTKTFRDLHKTEKSESEMTEQEKLDNLKQEYVPEVNLRDSYKAKKK